MSSDLITSTMKSEPGVPLVFSRTWGTPVSVAATRAVGGSTDGRLALGASVGVEVSATAGATADAAPATATLVRNLRRSTPDTGLLLAMMASPDVPA